MLRRSSAITSPSLRGISALQQQLWRDYATRIGIRREDKSVWERRTPLTPKHVEALVQQHGLDVIVQPSNVRCFSNEEYARAGAKIEEDLSGCPTIFALKEVPKEKLLPDRTYLYFSHTIKAQPYNMAMLDTILQKNIRLVDYEKILDDDGKRLVQFGKFAGLSGAVDTLHILGERLLMRDGFSTPFINIGWARNYSSLDMAKEAVKICGQQIADIGLPAELSPFVITTTGSGAVAHGLLEIVEQLPCKFVEAKDLPKIFADAKASPQRQKFVYVCKTTAKDMAKHAHGKPFDKKHYYENPHEYIGTFHETVMPYTSVLLNGIYWEQRFPRLVTTAQAQQLLAEGRLPLVVVGDVSCDIGGSIEFLHKSTTIPDPFFIYDLDENKLSSDLTLNKGVAVLGVDNWPAAFPKSASTHFGNCLLPFVAGVARADMSGSYEKQRSTMPPEMHRAMIALHNELTPPFRYIADLRQQHEQHTSKAQAKGHKVLLVGSGMVVSPVIEYLMRFNHISKLTIATNDAKAADKLVDQFSKHEKTEGRLCTEQLDVADDKQQQHLDRLVAEHDVVLSLLPAPLHPFVAKSCIRNKTDMITTSYISPAMRELEAEAKKAGIMILNEIGLDPGIDHMTVMKMVEEAKQKKMNITSFKSLCGALPAPESSANPLGYKFSWSPRGVLSAAQNAAKYIKHGEEINVPGEKLMFAAEKLDDVHMAYPGFAFEVIPNRDSLSYIDYYGLDRNSIQTMMRGTLRFPGFTTVFKGLKALGFLNESEIHLNANSWFDLSRSIIGCHQASNEAQMTQAVEKILAGKFQEIAPQSNYQRDAAYAAFGMKTLGFFSKEQGIPDNTQGVKVVDMLCQFLQKQLAYQSGEDRDMIYMHHEIEMQDELEKKETLTSTLCVYGDKNGFSATAKTVGYPIAIAAEMLLSGQFDNSRKELVGVIGPTKKVIYDKVLEKLEHEGIRPIEHQL